MDGGLAYKTLLKLTQFGTGPGDDKLKLKTTLFFEESVGLQPQLDGLRVLIEDADGAVFAELDVPPGLYDPLTRSGWVPKPSGTRYPPPPGPGEMVGLPRARSSGVSHRRLRERARRLYEPGGDRQRLRLYVLRWWRWVHSGLGEGRSALVSRQGGYERTWSQVRIHLDLHRPP